MSKTIYSKVERLIYLIIIVSLVIIIYFYKKSNNKLYENLEFNKKFTIFQTSLIGGKYEISLKYIADISYDKTVPKEFIDLLIQQFWYSIGCSHSFRKISINKIANVPEKRFYDILMRSVQSDIINTPTLNIENITYYIPIIFTSNDLRINSYARIADIVGSKFPERVHDLTYSLYELRKTKPDEFNLINLPLKLSIFLYVKDYDSILKIRKEFINGSDL